MSKRKQIIELLKQYLQLICNYVYPRSITSVRKVVEVEEWKDPKFQPLLTSTIWNSNYESIQSKLKLPYWNDYKYEHLFTSTLFVIKIEYIVGNIELMEEYNLTSYIKMNTLRRNPIEQRNLIEHLVENNIDLVVSNKLNPILNMPSTKLKREYGIDLKKIREERKDKHEYQYRISF